MFKSSHQITRRALLLAATLLTGVVIAGGVALAETLTCTTNPCNGTENADVITGTDPDPTANITGNDTINGLGGDDQISALGGSDSVTGGAGNDTMDGGIGRDSYLFADSFGADRIEADSHGVDTIDFSGITTAPATGFINGITFDLEGPDSLCEPTSTNCLSLGGSFVENVVGTAFTDKLTGNAKRNKIAGGDGYDQIYGGDGPDQLVGGTGGDGLTGEAGNDKLIGSTEAVDGTIIGLNDSYRLTPNWGKDTIIDARGAGSVSAASATAAAMPPLTVNLVSDPTRPEVKDGQGNTVNWEGEDVRSVGALGGGDDVIWQKPGASNGVNGGAGSDTYKGYTTDPFGGDSILDSSGPNDVLDFSAFNLVDAKLWKASRSYLPTSTGNIENLTINFSGSGGGCIEEFCRYVYISGYFDNTSTDVCASGAGPGTIETIKFRDDESVDFEQVKSLLGCP